MTDFDQGIVYGFKRGVAWGIALVAITAVPVLALLVVDGFWLWLACIGGVLIWLGVLAFLIRAFRL